MPSIDYSETLNFADIDEYAEVYLKILIIII